MAKQKKKKQTPEINPNPHQSESGKSTKNSDGTYSYKKDDGTKVTFDPSKRGRNSRGQFTDGIGDPTIRLGALPILKIKEAFETGDMDAQARTLLATRLAGLIALVTQVLEHNSRKQREKNKE